MKIVAAEALRLADWIRPGDQIMWGEGVGEPTALLRRLRAQAAEIGPVSAFIGFGLTPTLSVDPPPTIRFSSYGALGTCRALARAGRLDILPHHIGMLPHLIERGYLPCDVALIHVSAPGPDGRFSLGASVMHMPAAVARARCVIAQINTAMVYTLGHATIGPDQIDVAIEVDDALVETTSSAPDTADAAIAAHVADYIDDGATLQLGIGNVPDAVAGRLGDRRDLGVHSGMIGNSLLPLITRGVVTNARKSIDVGISVAGILVGDRSLYGAAHDNPSLHLRPSSYTHDPTVLASLHALVAVNSALEVDLSGQVNAESINGAAIGAIGGQADFLRAAHRSAKGHAIVALQATRPDGSGCIVPTLAGPVSTPRSDIDVVVTQHGAADLRGLSLDQRRVALIGIADPAHRSELASKA